jgi:hypothetical protein
MRKVRHSTEETASPGGSTLRILLPLLVAGTLVWLEPVIGRLAHERPGIVPVALLSLAVGVLSPGSRRWLVSSLCFGVAILAFRDVFRAMHIPDLPSGYQSSAYVKIYTLGWVTLGLLASTAAVGEAVRPGAVWGKRCYFLAVAVYFGGHGLLGYLREPNWKSIAMVVIGMVGLWGAFVADRLVEPPMEPEPLDEDLREIADRTSTRSAMLARREWLEKR